MLLQKDTDSESHVVYASRALSETERRYAQIEKEAFTITWSWEKFSDWILGSQFEIETDHKPLVPLMSSKHLERPYLRARTRPIERKSGVVCHGVWYPYYSTASFYKDTARKIRIVYRSKSTVRVYGRQKS